jgi:hypothetical protein
LTGSTCSGISYQLRDITLHLILATFNQHLHMGFIFLSKYDIQALCILYLCSEQRYTAVTGVTCSYIEVFGSLTIVVMNKISSTFIVHAWPITGFVTRLTQRVPLVEQELLTLPEHLNSPPVLAGFLLLDLYFYDRFLSLCPFSFSHCVVCPSWIYEF